LTMSRGGMLSIAVALAVTAALTLPGRQRTHRRGALALVVFIVAAVVGWIGPNAIANRFSEADWQEINARRGAWLDAWSIAQRFPLAGTGLNTYGRATTIYQRHNLELHFAQAHNDYLQLAAEGGALVAVPAIATLVAFVVVVTRRFRSESRELTYWVRAGAVTGLGAIALQETVDFSLQMPGNAFLFATLCAIALHRTPARPAGPGIDRAARTPDRGDSASAVHTSV
jgi:O-antigen ligase